MLNIESKAKGKISALDIIICTQTYHFYHVNENWITLALKGGNNFQGSNNLQRVTGPIA